MRRLNFVDDFAGSTAASGTRASGDTYDKLGGECIGEETRGPHDDAVRQIRAAPCVGNCRA
jgi:hypothetical protein